GDRPPRRLQGGRWNPAGEAGGAAPRARARDAWTGVADAGAVSARRVVSPQRHPDAAPQGAHRGLPERRLLHAGLNRHLFVTEAAQSREPRGRILAPSHKGGGWVWG